MPQDQSSAVPHAEVSSEEVAAPPEKGDENQMSMEWSERD